MRRTILFMFTQIALQAVTLTARSLRRKGLKYRRFRCFGHERQERGLTRTSRDSKVIKVNLINWD